MTDRTYTWKPALAVGRTTAVIADAGLLLTRGRREWRLDFGDITAVRFIEIVGRTSSCSLVFATAGRKMVAHCGGQLADAAHDANARAYVAACAAALDALARARPDVEVSFGGGPGLRACMSMLGVAVALMGGGLTILGLFGGELSELWLTALVGAVMAYSGVQMAISFNPFRKPQRIAAGELARSMAALAAA